MGSKVNSQQALVQWLSEITKAKLNPFYSHLFIKTMGKEGKREIRTCLGKLGQVRTRQQIGKMGGKGMENKKREQKFE